MLILVMAGRDSIRLVAFLEEVLLHMRPRDAIAVTIYPTLSTL